MNTILGKTLKIINSNILLQFILILALFTSCKKDGAIESGIAPLTSKSNLTLNNNNPLAATDFLTVNPLGSGVDNVTVLQNAINSGKPISLTKGTYLISKPLVKSSGSLIIKGTEAIIQLAPSFAAGKSGYTGAFVLCNLTSLSITGLTIDGNRSNLKNAGPDWTNYIMGLHIYNSSNIQLSSCKIINAPSISFSFQNVNYLKIDSCLSTNGMYHGICLQYCNNVSISNSKIIGIGNQGTSTNKGGIGILGTGGSYLTFTSNYIENISDTGTKTEGANNVTWIGNTVKNSGKDGIKFQNLTGAGQVPVGHSPVTTALHAKIANNIVDHIFNGRSDGSSLIEVFGAEDVQVTGNTIIGGSKTGYEYGISVLSSVLPKTTKITVANNKITNTNSFIYLSNVSTTTISNNICQNTIAPLSQYNGFQAEMSDNIRIISNTFQRSGTGIKDGFAASLFDCSSFTFNNNKLLNAYSALAIKLISAQADSILNNQMDNFYSYGISVYSTTPATLVKSLVFTGNSVSHMGMAMALGYMFKIDPANLTINSLDVSNTKISGNGKNGDWGLTIQGTKNITAINMTSFYADGNAAYPSLAALTGCSNIVGWKSLSAPTSGYWQKDAMVYNAQSASVIKGWKCTSPGTPGSWQQVK
ncbi:MAG TPA: right-handed parallel beta-helix repeat-containing protein [Mucilaginibacter sp.]|nr:right-handed parallel beta-helix repeat-containing protein [Mucilaginibacter sp.]